EKSRPNAAGDDRGQADFCSRCQVGPVPGRPAVFHQARLRGGVKTGGPSRRAATSDDHPYHQPSIRPKERHVSFVKTKDGVEIFYKDWGKGQPIVFSHGWPLSADDWDTQMLFFLKHGYRVIAHDRRGHGRSTQVSDGHDMDHYADDLAAVTA